MFSFISRLQLLHISLGDSLVQDMYDRFFFERPSINGRTYLEMYQVTTNTTGFWRWWLHFSTGRRTTNFREFLNTNLPNRWIVSAGQDDNVFSKTYKITRPGSLWLFPLWISQEQSLRTSLASNHGWTAQTFQRAVQAITPDILQIVWMELEYHLDIICKVVDFF